MTKIQKIKEDIQNRPHFFSCFDQPYIVYNAFKYGLYDNKQLIAFVVNNDMNIHSNKIIHHFPGTPGYYHIKINKMTYFLNSIKDYTKYPQSCVKNTPQFRTINWSNITFDGAVPL